MNNMLKLHYSQVYGEWRRICQKQPGLELTTYAYVLSGFKQAFGDFAALAIKTRGEYLSYFDEQVTPFKTRFFLFGYWDAKGKPHISGDNQQKMPQISTKMQNWLRNGVDVKKTPKKPVNRVKMAYREMCSDYRIVRRISSELHGSGSSFLVEALDRKWGNGWKLAILASNPPTYWERNGEFMRYRQMLWAKIRGEQYGPDDIPF